MDDHHRVKGSRPGASLFRFPRLQPLPRVGPCLVATLVSAAVRWLVSYDPSLPAAANRSLCILVLAAILWFTDAAPPFSVGIRVIALNIPQRCKKV